MVVINLFRDLTNSKLQVILNTTDFAVIDAEIRKLEACGFALIDFAC